MTKTDANIGFGLARNGSMYSSKEMIFKKVYYAPIAERFAVEEDCRLLENSFQIGEGGDDYGEAKPIGGFTLENESEDIYSNQIWHD